MSDGARRIRAIRAMVVAHMRASYREPGGLFWTYGFPILLSLVLGLAFRSRAPEPPKVAVVGARAEATAAMLQKNGEVVAKIEPADSAERDLRTGKVDAVVIAEEGTVEYRFDPTRPEARLAKALADHELQVAAGAEPKVPTKDTIVTEVGARYIDFLWPGLLGLGLMSTGLWGIGFSLADMRGKKLLRRIVATPMRRSDFLASFLLVRLVLLFVEVPPLLLFGHLFFSISVRGSPLALLVTLLLGALLFASLGLLLASRSQNPQIVSGLINIVSFPMYLGSGVFFSASRFPAKVEPLLRVLPLTALNDAIRAIITDGAGFAEVSRPLLYLAVWTAVVFFGAVKLFKFR